jgi:hypothetical protein
MADSHATTISNSQSIINPHCFFRNCPDLHITLPKLCWCFQILHPLSRMSTESKRSVVQAWTLTSTPKPKAGRFAVPQLTCRSFWNKGSLPKVLNLDFPQQTLWKQTKCLPSGELHFKTYDRARKGSCTLKRRSLGPTAATGEKSDIPSAPGRSLRQWSRLQCDYHMPRTPLNWW